MPERHINGPAKDYLTEAEAAEWLGLEADDFREFVRMGCIPRGLPWGKIPKKHRWHWLDVVAIGHLVSRGFIRLPGDEEESEEGEKEGGEPPEQPPQKRPKTG
jgi:hypothetical protein